MAQAARVVATFAPQAVYASPLGRAQQTAACLAGPLGLPVRTDGGLREWHRTERLHEVSVRMASWLVRWLRGGETCAVVVSHASPLLALLRSALYLPHVGWYRTGHPERLELSSADRFEVSMASVFELVLEPACVTARCVCHARPRVLSVWNRHAVAHLPRPVVGDGENRVIRRPNRLNLIGYGAWSPSAVVRDGLPRREPLGGFDRIGIGGQVLSPGAGPMLAGVARVAGGCRPSTRRNPVEPPRSLGSAETVGTRSRLSAGIGATRCVFSPASAHRRSAPGSCSRADRRGSCGSSRRVWRRGCRGAPSGPPRGRC